MVLLGFIYYFIFLTLYIVNVVSKQHVYVIFIEKKNIFEATWSEGAAIL